MVQAAGSGQRAEAPFGFDSSSPAFLAEPYPVYARLREEAPIVFLPPRWVVSRYDDVVTVLRHPEFGRSGFDGVMFGAFGPGPLYDAFSRWMLFLDAPDHTRLRSLATKAFTPRAVERLRAEVQRLVDDRLDELEANGGGDLIATLAYPLPVMVICALLGVPDEDHAEFRAWSDGLGRALQVTSATPEIVADGNRAAEQVTEYFRGLVAEHRAHPRDDLLGALIAAEDEGGKLSEDELLAMCSLLYLAGHETTVNLIGNGTLALLRHPDQLERLRAEPALIPNAIEELLRYDGSVQVTSRLTKAPVRLGGVDIPAGQLVVCLLGAANRDPARFPDPDRLDVARQDVHHLTFGGGVHYCLGAALARLEGQIALGTLVRRFPHLRLAGDELEWRPNATLRGLKALPVLC